MSDETKPKRIQLRRTAGWRLPPNTVSVALVERMAAVGRVLDQGEES